MERKCKLVQDLLPSYIDGVTSEDTKNFVEEHLKECKDCKKYFEEMNSEFDKNVVKDAETVKEIKKYKRKIFRLKFVVTAVVLAIVGVVVGNLGFKYYIVKNAIKANANNNRISNIRIEEYEESIEKNKDYTITYLSNNIMKKVHGDECIEFWDGNEHYYIDNENKTYYIVNENIVNEETLELNYKINLDINVIPEMKEIIDEDGNDFFNIMKFILTTEDLVIGKEGFRDTEYYIIKDALEHRRMYFDMDDFFIQKSQLNQERCTEYRMLKDSARWHDVKKPDLSGYKKVER